MSKVFLGGRYQLMANRSSQTVIMYCTSQNFRYLWITIYGLVRDDSHFGDIKRVERIQAGTSSHNDHNHILYREDNVEVVI